jgi:hypothetical protein
MNNVEKYGLISVSKKTTFSINIEQGLTIFDPIAIGFRRVLKPLF